MANGLRIEGLSGFVADVIATAAAWGDALKVALSDNELGAGFAALTSEVDAGTVTGARSVRALEVSKDYRLRTAIDTLLFEDKFDGAAINSAIWTAPVTTATVTVVANVGLTLNAGLSTASGAVARVTSYASFKNVPSGTLWWECVLVFTQNATPNNVCEWGMAIATGTVAPTAGAFFRLASDGTLRGVVVDGTGAEAVTADIGFASKVGQNTSRHFIIGIGDDDVSFWIDDVMVGKVLRPAAANAITNVQSLPTMLRLYNSAIAGAAQTMKVGYVGVTQGDLALNQALSAQRAASGDMSYQGPTGGTMGSTALYTNSLAPGAGAAATNTTAALGSGLGGQFALLPTLTANTDGIVSSYQVPLGTAAVPGKSLVITGLKITGVVTTVLVGGPVIGAWSLAFGHTAVSLATTETATSKAPRRIPLGIQVFAAAAAVAARDDREIECDFKDAPIIVQPGEFVQAVLKNMGTVTSSGVITFEIQVRAYWK